MDDEVRLAAEQRARVLIDQQLTGAGWAVVDRKDLNLFTPRGSAVREAIMKPGHGRADYLLYVDKQVVGVIEAKAQGTPLSGVEWQSAMYATGLPEVARQRPVLVAGRSRSSSRPTGSETHFTSGYDPHPRARRFFGFPQPRTLARWIREASSRGTRLRRRTTTSTEAAEPHGGKNSHMHRGHSQDSGGGTSG